MAAKAKEWPDEPIRSAIVTAGGTKAMVKLWSTDGSQRTLWEKDFGGKFSRMRDLEVADINADGFTDIAVVTHDQGVVAVLYGDGSGGFTVEELDAEPNTFVHEVEVGDLNGDGVLEVPAEFETIQAAVNAVLEAFPPQ